MKVSTITLLLGVVLVLMAHHATSKPAQKERGRDEVHEEARRRWSGAKRLYRRLVTNPRRYKKQVPSANTAVVDEPLDQDIADPSLAGNLSVSKYIIDLYNSFSNSSGSNTLQHILQANTIRSLESVATVPSCDVFSFNISAIGSNEFILKSELHLYMTREIAQVGNVYVVIRRYKKGEETGIVTSEEVLPTKGSSWLVFEVQHDTADLVKNGENHAVFKIDIYRNLQDINRNPYSCADSPIKFHYLLSGTPQPEIEPYLAVYSYNPDISKIDYQSMLNIKLQEAKQIQGNTPAARRRRTISNTESPPSCRVNQLTIQGSDIPWKDDEYIVRPITYNAGICGGACGSTLPTSEELRHTQIVHLLVNLDKFEESQYTFQQCCAPVKYSSLQILVRPKPSTGRNMYMSLLAHMRISQCECLDVIEFKKSTTR